MFEKICIENDTCDYYDIPDFSRYAISVDGVVIDKITSMVIPVYTNPDGYCLYSLKNDNGKVCWRSQHRLICIVFKNSGIDYPKLQVNHINGIKNDNQPENLEWVTPKENCEHAGMMGLTEKCLPISMRNADTGEVIKFPSIVECARYLGVSKDAINYRVHIGETRVFPERNQYRFGHSDHPWFIPDNIDISLMSNGTTKKILMRYVSNNTVLEFNKLTDLATHLNVSPSLITRWINLPNQPLLPGWIQLKMANDLSPWRLIGDVYLELSDFNRLSRPVQVINKQTGEKKMYLSALECSKDMGLKPTALNYRLKSKGQTVFSDGFSYGYYPY